LEETAIAAFRVSNCMPLLALVWTLTFVNAAPTSGAARAFSTGVSGSTLTATIDVKGLRATLQIPPGPYFLSEMLDIRVVLSNHGKNKLFLDGPPTQGPCGSALWVEVQGGAAPFFTLNEFVISCPAPLPTPFAPGHAITVHYLVPLTASQRVVLVLQGRFVAESGNSGDTTAPDPLNGHWPSIAVNVSPRVPANRAIALSFGSHRLLVRAPRLARTHLFLQYSFGCSGPNGYGTGIFWTQLKSEVAPEPICDGGSSSWWVDVGAPGFAIAIGQSGV
jgi:hypothetical protein